MKFVLIILWAFILTGCVSTEKNGDTLPQITFDHINPYPLYVASYETVALPVENVPNSPVGFVTKPDRMILGYLNSRFEASGYRGKLLIKIQSVDIKHERVDDESSLINLIGVNKKDHYRVSVTIDIEAHGVNNIEWKKQSMTVYRDIYISENVSLVEREKIELRAMDNMIDDLDIALRKVLERKFGIFRQPEHKN